MDILPDHLRGVRRRCKRRAGKGNHRRKKEAEK